MVGENETQQETTPHNSKPDREIALRLDCSDFGWEQTKNINKALMLGRCECGCPVSLEVMEGCPQDGE